MEYAKLYLKEDSKEHYFAATLQSTLPYTKEAGTNKSLLNEVGLKEFNRIQKLFALGKHNKIIYNHQLRENINSGGWTGSKDSKYYDNVIMVGNTHNNILVLGDTLVNSKPYAIRTGIVIFFTNEWIYTVHGNIYKLGGQLIVSDSL